jgi:hypothetical protein
LYKFDPWTLQSISKGQVQDGNIELLPTSNDDMELISPLAQVISQLNCKLISPEDTLDIGGANWVRTTKISARVVSRITLKVYQLRNQSQGAEVG